MNHPSAEEEFETPLIIDTRSVTGGDEVVGNGRSVTTPPPRREEKRQSLASLGGVGGDWEKLEKMYPDGGIRLAGPSNSNSSTPSKGKSKSTSNGTPKRKPSLSVSGKTFLGGIFGTSGGGASSNRDDTSSTRPSLSPNGLGRRSSYFAANAINSARSSTPSISEDSPSISTSASSRSLVLPSGLPMPSSTPTPPPSTPSIYSTHARGTSNTPTLQNRSLHSQRPISPSLLSPTNSSPRSSISPTQLISGLLRASHAESLQGSMSDLLVLLDRTSTGSKVEYGQVEQKVEVWYGDRDDRISEVSVRWLEKEMRDCKVRIVKGGDHNLMTSESRFLP